MAVIANVTMPGATLEQYDQLRALVGWLEEPPIGGIVHLVWADADGLHGTDAWDSEEAFATFGQERMGPALAKLGITTEMQVTFQPAHEVYAPHAVKMT